MNEQKPGSAAGSALSRDVRVFIASPDALKLERNRVERVVLQLNQAVAEHTHFRVIRWERGFYAAHAHPQDQIIDPADCDVVIVLFGHQLGSTMPESFAKRLPDGSRYPSGTAYELLSAIEAAERNGGRPAVYVFRTSAEPQFALSQASEMQAALVEKARLDEFMAQWFRTPAGETLRHVHPFSDLEHLSEQVSDLLLEWAGLTASAAPVWSVERDGSPFVGLEQFDARHSPVYFGRDRKVERAIGELVQASRRERGLPFLLVTGPSGSGKSSLVRAGLVPRLTKGNQVGEVDSWRVAVMRPGASTTPFLAAAQALYVDGASAGDHGGFGSALPELAAGPYRSPAQLAEVLENSPSSAALPIVAALDQIGDGERQASGFTREIRTDLLLVVDQLEEVFAGDTADSLRGRFAQLLTTLARSGRVWIVATLRADLYPQLLDKASPFLALKDSGGMYDLASPGDAELSEILHKSAAAAGIVYGIDPASGERLDERLMLDAAGPDTLPLLQFSLKLLFEMRREIRTQGRTRFELTFDAYRAIGGLDGAIDTVAEQKIKQLGRNPAEIERVLARLLRHLAVQVASERTATTSGPGLTVRAAPLALAAPDAESRTLVELLVSARLLTLMAAREREPFVRLAHERVLSSWRRARDIVAAHRDYFRVRADVEQQALRWEAGHRRREFLLPAGTALQDAQRVVREFPAEMQAPLRDFVAASSRRARMWQRVMAGAAGAFFLLFLLASGFALLATRAERKAERDYAAAKGAADQLVTSIASDLRDQEGISSTAIDSTFQVVERLIGLIRDGVTAKDDFSLHELQAAFARVLAVAVSPGEEDQVARLDRSRADMLFEFATTYHLTDNSPGKANAMAEESLSIRQHLSQAGGSPELQDGVAESEMLLADIERRRLERAPRLQAAPPPNFGGVRHLLDAALGSLDPLLAEMPDSSRLTQDVSRVLTKLGDLDMKDQNPEAATQRYSRAQRLALAVFRRAPEDPVAVGELAWTYRKLGESLKARREYEDAFRSIVTEICVRRRLVALQPGKLRPQQDLGWALEAAGSVRLAQRAVSDDVAHDVVYEALYRRIKLAQDNPTRVGLFLEIGRSLQQARDLYAAQDNAGYAEQFAAAGAALKTGIAEAFPTKQPQDDAAAMMTLRLANQRREAGPLAMLGPARFAVELAMSEFAQTDLKKIESDADGCWGEFMQTADVGR